MEASRQGVAFSIPPSQNGSITDSLRLQSISEYISRHRPYRHPLTSSLVCRPVSGGRDYLVLTEPLLERLEKHEKDVRVIRVKKMEEGEHCDFFWHVDAVELCFESMLEDIEKTRPRYPDEDGVEHYHPSHRVNGHGTASSAPAGLLQVNGARERGKAKVNGRAAEPVVKGAAATGRRVTRSAAATSVGGHGGGGDGGNHVAFADHADED